MIDWPTASSAVYPNSCSAPLFHDVMMPVRSLLTMASSDDSTIAARRNAASGGKMLMSVTALYSSDYVIVLLRSSAGRDSHGVDELMWN